MFGSIVEKVSITEIGLGKYLPETLNKYLRANQIAGTKMIPTILKMLFLICSLLFIDFCA